MSNRGAPRISKPARTKNTYYVFRRNDGYVSSTCGSPAKGWTGTNGKVTTFEQLGQFTDWGDAYALIAKERRDTQSLRGLLPKGAWQGEGEPPASFVLGYFGLPYQPGKRTPIS
jgi:hypothetical protein